MSLYFPCLTFLQGNLSHYLDSLECNLMYSYKIFRNIQLYWVNSQDGKKKFLLHTNCLFFFNLFGSHQTLSQVALRFKIGLGSLVNYVNNITLALRALAPGLIAWPDKQEREILKDYYKRHYFWDNAVGAVDGSCIPLSYCPSECGGDYFDRSCNSKPLLISTINFFFPTHICRKSNYSINVQFVLDPDARVRYWFGGVPGSTHDSR